MEQIQHNFLWGHTEDVFKFHLVKWEQVCNPLTNGGLAIRNLRRFNEVIREMAVA